MSNTLLSPDIQRQQEKPEGWAIEIGLSHYHDGTRDFEASHYAGSWSEATARAAYARLNELYEKLYESRSPDGDGHVAVRETTGKPRTPETVEHRSVEKATTPPQVPQRQRTEAGCAGSIPASSSTAGSEPADSLQSQLTEAAAALTVCQQQLEEALKAEGQKDAWIDMLSQTLRAVVVAAGAPDEWEGSVNESVDFLSQRFVETQKALDATEAALTVCQQEKDRVAGWQPIATAPKDGRLIIGALIRDGQVWRVHEMKHNGLAFYTKAGGSLPQMTHWIPLPDSEAVAALGDLRSRLQPYLQHKSDCGVHSRPGYGGPCLCTCGLRENLDRQTQRIKE